MDEETKQFCSRNMLFVESVRRLVGSASRLGRFDNHRSDTSATRGNISGLGSIVESILDFCGAR